MANFQAGINELYFSRSGDRYRYIIWYYHLLLLQGFAKRSVWTKQWANAFRARPPRACATASSMEGFSNRSSRREDQRHNPSQSVILTKRFLSNLCWMTKRRMIGLDQKLLIRKLSTHGTTLLSSWWTPTTPQRWKTLVRNFTGQRGLRTKKSGMGSCSGDIDVQKRGHSQINVLRLPIWGTPPSISKASNICIFSGPTPVTHTMNTNLSFWSTKATHHCQMKKSRLDASFCPKNKHSLVLSTMIVAQ